MDKQRKKHFLGLFSNGYGSRGTSGGLDPTKSWMVCTDAKNCPKHCCTTDYKQCDDVNLIATPPVPSSYSFTSVWNEKYHILQRALNSHKNFIWTTRRTVSHYSHLATTTLPNLSSTPARIHHSFDSIGNIKYPIECNILALSRQWRSPQIATHICSYTRTSKCKTSHTSILCEDALDQESASSHLWSIDFTLNPALTRLPNMNTYRIHLRSSAQVQLSWRCYGTHQV